MPKDPFITRLLVKNYKSIGECDVELNRLTLIVGKNGSGKSNLLDTLRFIADSLQISLDHAIKSRGGIDFVRRRSTGHPHNFSIGVEMNLPDYRMARYGFEIGAQKKGGFIVKSEDLVIVGPTRKRQAFFRVANDTVIESSSDSAMPPVASDRLYLVNASGLPEFRPVYDGLTAMGFYNLNPQLMKEPQSPDAGELLRRDGSNIASVVARLSDDRPDVSNRIRRYVQTIVPDVEDFQRTSLGHHETLEFRQRVIGSDHPWRFYAASMSDGTLRALGVLVAVMQLADRKEPVRLVGIEEPETALHPAASAVLMNCLREAAEQTQVLVTTHSPDLLDQFDPANDGLLVVQFDQGTSLIGPADAAAADAIRSHLYTAGDLLRKDQLEPVLSGQPQREFAFETTEDAP